MAQTFVVATQLAVVGWHIVNHTADAITTTTVVVTCQASYYG